MPIGIFTVSMPDYEPLAALEKAKEWGYDGVEWRVAEDKGDRSKPSFWSGNRTSMTAAELLDRAAALRAKAGALGLAMPAIGSYIDCWNLESVELHMRAAAALGAASLRIGPGRYSPDAGPYPVQVENARAQYAKVAELAERHRVRALIETHMNQLAPSITKAMNILRGLDPARVGIMWDPGNQVMEGREVFSMAIEEAGEYLGEVHVKNMRWAPDGKEERGQKTWSCQVVPLREGQVSWPQVIDLLRARNYTGWLMTEDFSTVVPLEERMRENLGWLRSLLG